MLKSLRCEHLPKRRVKWRKTINEIGGNIPGENFLGSILPGGIFQSGVWFVGISGVGIPSGGIFIEPSSSYNVSILTYQIIYQIKINIK